MDQSWMHMKWASVKYLQGVDGFIAAALEYKSKTRLGIRCPCFDCNNTRIPESMDLLKDHLIRRGFTKGYTRWTWHGEALDISESSATPKKETILDSVVRDKDVGDEVDRLDKMMRDVEDNFMDNPAMFESIHTASKTELFPGCVKWTTLSAVLKLFNMKTRHNITDEYYKELLQVFADMLPDGNTLPNNLYKVKKLMCPMGLEYERIHACAKDCVLFRNEYANLEACPRCGSSRYKKNGLTNKRVPSKVLWYLPIIPRFKRLFAEEKIAQLLRWHSDARKDDKLMRHTTNSPQWRRIDDRFPVFGNEARNLRLGLCTDGMNPFGNLSSQWSTWPVILTIYNLPPWLCMKRKYLLY